MPNMVAMVVIYMPNVVAVTALHVSSVVVYADSCLSAHLAGFLRRQLAFKLTAGFLCSMHYALYRQPVIYADNWISLGQLVSYAGSWLST